MNQVKPDEVYKSVVGRKDPIVKLDQAPKGPNSGLFLDLKRNKVTKYLLASLLVAFSFAAIGFGFANSSLNPELAKATSLPQPYAQITSINVVGLNYSVNFTTDGYTNVQGGMHTHFYFNNEDSTVMNKMYTGASPYILPIGLEILNGATELCVVASNPDHSIILNSGNCVSITDSIVRTGGDVLAANGVTNLQAATTESGVNITYNTAVATTQTISVGLTASTTAPVTISNEISPTTNHTISLSNLLPCTNYYFTLTVNVSGQNIVLPAQEFNSGGCEGDINPERTLTDQVITTAAKVLSELDTNSKGIILNIPAGTFTENRIVQISKLEQAVNEVTNGLTTAPTLPDGLKPIESHVYEIKNYVNGLLAPSTDFNLPINFTINYSPSDIAGVDPESLTVKSWDGVVWKNHVCTNDLALGQLTCSTNHFTTFVLAGSPSAPNTIVCTQTDPCAFFESNLTFSPLQSAAKRYGASGTANTGNLTLTINDGRLESTSLCTFKYKFRTDTTWRTLATDVAYNTTSGCSATLLPADQLLFNVDFEITARTDTTNYFLMYSNYDFKAGSIGVTSIGGTGL